MNDRTTGAELAAALLGLHDESVRYWDSFDASRFFSRIGEAWSPAENVRHLTKSIRAVNTGLAIPRWILWFRFRRPARPSRGYTELRDIYLARLAAGAKAGRFAPDPRPAPTDPEAERKRIMDFHRAAARRMMALIPRWSERSLDRQQLPHPALGWLTAREMLYFTLYHNAHHPANVKRLLAAAEGRSG